ncbi:hypothetical protein HMPREF0201_02891 [Cedecea davisae DSM 4568]|uniref:Uncharacterized protein n=1 Tax=Cedecea davisae DSM 4568 TaxID=566551 RepID=S3IVB8_9ENTR|nr:hypothetical protein HMPREF0201_02891 [Cedecea davisae DSM 4568]
MLIHHIIKIFLTVYQQMRDLSAGRNLLKSRFTLYESHHALPP